MQRAVLEYDYRQDIRRRDRRRFEDARRSLMPAGVRQALNERRWAMDQVDQAAKIVR